MITKVCFVCVFLSAATTFAQRTEHAPISDIPTQFAAVPDQGELVEFERDFTNVGQVPNGYRTGFGSHFQGIQPLKQGYFAVSGSGKDAGHLFVLTSKTAGGRLVVARRDISKQTGLTNAHHAGGLQVLGDYLVVALEISKGLDSKIAFFDVRNPFNPTYLYSLDRDNEEAGAVGIARVDSGQFLLAVGQNNSDKIDFYVSEKNSLVTNPAFVKFKNDWDQANLKTTINDSEFGNYQNLNLFTQSDGSIYMIGTHRDSNSSKDWADLFTVVPNIKGSEVTVTKVAKRHMYVAGFTSLPNGGFDAGAGFAVNNDGKLVAYAVDLWYQGANPAKMRVNDFDAWEKDFYVHLYDDKNFKDRNQSFAYTSSIADYDEFTVGGKKGFEDKASSAKWRLPQGVTYQLFEDKNYRGGVLELTGSGECKNLKDEGFGDKISSSRPKP